MVPTGNPTSTGGTEESRKNIEKTDTAFRPITPIAKDDRKGQKFKEVLNKKLSEDKDETSTVSGTGDEDEREDSISPLTLAALAPVKKTKDALSTITYEEDEAVIEEPDAPKPKKLDAGLVAEDIPEDVLNVVETTVKKPLEEGKSALKLTSAPVEKEVEESDAVTSKGDDKKIEGVAVVKPHDVTPKPVVAELVKEKIVEHHRPVSLAASKETAATIDKDDDDEKPIVTQVNLAVTPNQGNNTMTAAVQKAPEAPAKAREVFIKLAEQMIEKLERVTTPEQTNTTIKLQYPPIFNGAELVVTEYKIAQRQFNITFSGLSPEAQSLIAMQQNQGELRQALIEKGYTLQMVTIKQDIPGLQSLATGQTSAEKREKGEKGTQGDDAGGLG
jgi:hypothetical protein